MMESNSHLCEECCLEPNLTFCIDCEQKLCLTCDEKIHRGGKRKSHKRQYQCRCGGVASGFCTSCSRYLCESCAYVHSHATIQKISSTNFVVVFWDTAQKNISEAEVKQCLDSLYRTHPSILELRVYDLPRNSNASNFIHKARRDERFRSDSSDISLYLKDSISEILLISTRASLYKVHLNQIQLGMPGIKLMVSTSFPYLKFLQVKDLYLETCTSSLGVWESRDQRGHKDLREQSESWDMPVHRPGKLGFRPSSEAQVMKNKYLEFLPVYQNFHRQKGQSYSHDLLINMMKELAEKGQIMNDAGWLCKNFSQKARLTMESSRDIIKEAERLGNVHTIERSFTDLKTMCFTCLKIESLSCESLTWALRSLKSDEMLPSERAVQSRIKEVFDYKIPSNDWESFIESCKNRHVHSKSGSESYSLFSETSTSTHPFFILKQVPDPVTKQQLLLIYPKGEEWESKDQFIKEGDVLGVKLTSDWKAFVDFLAMYFEGCVAGDDSRAIPGGRYGCAQFLKFCGNNTLKDCSLGKLSYMVQLSIDEYLLRYYRTLLVWVPSTQKSPSDKENSEKISFVQGKILEILKENREGLSLAQLPLYIKRKINSSVNLAELGFAKLKDLLMTMDDVQVELRGNNHPFAVYKSKKTKKLEEEAKTIIEDAVLHTVNGITSQKLEKVLNEQLGSTISKLRGSGLLDFIEKNCPSIEMQKTEKLTIFKRKLENNEKVCIKILHESGRCLKNEYFAGTFHSYFDSNTFSNPPGF